MSHRLIFVGSVPASYRAACFQSNEHFVHFQFVSCLPSPLGDVTLPDTLPSLPRDLHQCRTFPLVRDVLAWGVGPDEGSHFHSTVLSHGDGVRPQRSSPARWRLLPPQLPYVRILKVRDVIIGQWQLSAVVSFQSRGITGSDTLGLHHSSREPPCNR